MAEQTEQALRELVSGLPDDAQKTVAGSFEQLLASDVANDAIRVSDTALDFTLPNAQDGLLQLSDVLKQGPAVLISTNSGGYLIATGYISCP
ncbi:MAG: hypothetical protein ABFS22_07075 [Pseudomonadota bacterium]